MPVPRRFPLPTGSAYHPQCSQEPVVNWPRGIQSTHSRLLALTRPVRFFSFHQRLLLDLESRLRSSPVLVPADFNSDF